MCENDAELFVSVYLRFTHCIVNYLCMASGKLLAIYGQNQCLYKHKV